MLGLWGLSEIGDAKMARGVLVRETGRVYPLLRWGELQEETRSPFGGGGGQEFGFERVKCLP